MNTKRILTALEIKPHSSDGKKGDQLIHLWSSEIKTVLKAEEKIKTNHLCPKCLNPMIVLTQNSAIRAAQTEHYYFCQECKQHKIWWVE